MNVVIKGRFFVIRLLGPPPAGLRVERHSNK